MRCTTCINRVRCEYEQTCQLGMAQRATLAATSEPERLLRQVVVTVTLGLLAGAAVLLILGDVP